MPVTDPLAEQGNGTSQTMRLPMVSGDRGAIHLDAAVPQWQAELDETFGWLEIDSALRWRPQ